jgi:hypothetical protein
MNSKSPYRIEDINLSKIRYINKKVTNSKTIIYVKYEDKNKLNNFVFQTPSLRNVNDIVKKNGFYEMDIPLVGQNESKTNLLVEFLNNLDRKIINDGKINNDWFDNFIINDNIKYQRTIRENDNYNNGMIKVKILKNENFETIVQINNKDRIDISKVNKIINKNCWVKMILEVYAIWVNEKGFGLFLRPILVSFKPIEKIEYNYKLLDESDEDDVINTAVNEESIFLKQDSNNNSEYNNNVTSILEYPNVNKLSSTSSE